MEESLSLYDAPGPHVSVDLGHGDAYVLSVVNLPSAYAASASSPFNVIDLLDKRSLRRIQTLHGHDVATTSIRTVNCVVGMPTQSLISTGKDGSVKIWDGNRSGSHAIRCTLFEPQQTCLDD
jgi:WD40 repeat protein